MNTILAFDTETTGLPVWKEPSDSENQPHIVQLAAILISAETREEIASMDVIIKPEGWVIPDEVTKIHGITTEYALQVGIPEKLALEMFLELQKEATRISYNRTFDQRIIRIATKRFCSEEVIEAWADKETFHCAMNAAKPVVKCPAKTPGKIKNPKLQEAYEHFFGESFDGAHSALADTRACMRVHWATVESLAEA